MTWLIIILVAAIICAIIGYMTGEKGEKESNAAAGAVAGAMGCGYLLFHLFLFGVGLFFLIWLFNAIFG